jgi:purine nucleosidase
LWFGWGPSCSLLAAVAIFHPEVCEYTNGMVDVELESAELLGVTHFSPIKSGHHMVASSIDQQGFFELFFSVFEKH